MIVKNEADTIEDCLLSIDDWVDEIVIVDTGSTDKTTDIIMKFPKTRLFMQEWKEDFSFHRNYSMEQATKDWIFIIDADERVLPGHGENIKKMLPDVKQDIVAVNLQNLYMDNGTRIPRSAFKSLRFFRRSYGPSYVGRVHNRPLLKPDTSIIMLPLTVNHLGYDMPKEVMAEKHKRVVGMCRRWVEEEPENKEALLYLAQALRPTNGETEPLPEVISILKRAVDLPSENSDINNVQAQLLNLMAWIKYLNQENRDSISYAKRALALKPDYIDAMMILGFAYTYGVDAKEGERWLLRYLQEQEAYLMKDELNSIPMERVNDRKIAYKILIDIEDWKAKNVKALS